MRVATDDPVPTNRIIAAKMIPSATTSRSVRPIAAPPPFCYAGTGIGPGSGRAFTEAEALATGVLLDPGHTLLGEFLG